MPEPNLPPLRLSHGESKNPNVLDISKVELTELPDATRQKIMTEYGLNLEMTVRLVNEPELLDLFEKAQEFQPQDNVVMANLILIDLVHVCTKHFKDLDNCVPAEFLASACNMKIKKEISQNLIVKAFECTVLGEKYETFQDLLNHKGWLQNFRNDEVIAELIESVKSEEPKLIKKFSKKRNTKDLNQIVQLIMHKNEILDPAYVKTFVEQKLE